jgi:hypothetical protein
MIGIVSVWNVKCVRIVGFQNIIGFFFITPWVKHLIILDDLMDETDQRVASLFTKKSHHRNISVMYIVQNLFHRGKHHRCTNLLTKTDFPLPVGPEITLVNGWTHGMKWSGSYPSGT